jgi:carbon-monoxide dehydrogenase iron sulfur subunit
LKEIWVRPERCTGCLSCRLACAVAHSKAENLFGALTEEPPPRPRVYVEAVGARKVPLQCRHCREAPCVAACPVAALSYEEESGLVRYHRERCIGCNFCVLACPFGVIVFRRDEGRVIRCDRCHKRPVPACVVACPTRALVYEEGAAYQSAKRRSVVQAAFGRTDYAVAGVEGLRQAGGEG